MGVDSTNKANDFRRAVAVTRDRPCESEDWVAPQIAQELDEVKPQRMLFLADSGGFGATLAAQYAATLGKGSAVELVSTDFIFDKDPRKDDETGILSLNMNHLDKLAVPKVSFDLIIGRALICWCPPDLRRFPNKAGTSACGFPTADVDAGGRFLRRVWKLLNSTNKNAAAYLHGESGGATTPMLDFWRLAAVAAVKAQLAKSEAYSKGIKEGTGAAKMKSQQEVSYEARKGPFIGDMQITLIHDPNNNWPLRCIRIRRTGTGHTVD